jgi:hypothetical protein
MPGPHLSVARPLAAGAGNLPLVRAGWFASQQPAQRRSPRLMHGGSHRHLDSFQVEPACAPEIMKDDSEQPAYFAFNFLPDRVRRFFSCVLSVSAAGLA